VAEDTGFSRYLPIGEGLLSFSTVEEAADAIDRAAASYDTHCRRAREIAETYFASDVVLHALLERVGVRGGNAGSERSSCNAGAAVRA